MVPPAIDGALGMVAWLRGEFGTARTHFEQATAGLSEDDHHIEALWFIPVDPVALAHEQLARDRLAHGDLTGAEAELVHAMRRADQLGFPQGPYNRISPTRCVRPTRRPLSRRPRRFRRSIAGGPNVPSVRMMAGLFPMLSLATIAVQ